MTGLGPVPLVEVRPRHPVSVVCVFNDAAVLADCLVRSVEAGLSSAPDTELVAVDNTAQQFASAGAALNHGARRARHPTVAFVHQDVYLHSLPALERAAALLVTGEVAVLGAVGITAQGAIAGRIRDRVVLDGSPAASATDVDSLDEVLFAVSTARVLAEPLTEEPALAWHAYAVEYGLRQRRRGLRVAAGDIPLTHNSLSVNLARLEQAHQRVAELYPELVPVRTTCGVVGRPRRRLPGPLEPHRWRYRWLRQSLDTFSAHRAIGRLPVVLNDIRESVDDLLAASATSTVQVVNVDEDENSPLRAPVQLTRRGVPLVVAAGTLAEVVRRVCDEQGTSFLVTNIDVRTARGLCVLDHRPSSVGFSSGTGAWCVLGPVALGLAASHREPRTRPLDIRLATLLGLGSAGGTR